MKRRSAFLVVILTLAAAFAVTSCATGSRRSINNFMSQARRSAPEGAIVGFGLAQHGTPSLSMVSAEIRARAEVARQVESIVTTMGADYMAGSEASPQTVTSFTEAVTRVLAAQQLQGVTVLDSYIARDGTVLVAVAIPRASAQTQIVTAAQSSTRQIPGATDAFWALDRMDRAMNQNNMLPPVARNYD